MIKRPATQGDIDRLTDKFNKLVDYVGKLHMEIERLKGQPLPGPEPYKWIPGSPWPRRRDYDQTPRPHYPPGYPYPFGTRP